MNKENRPKAIAVYNKKKSSQWIKPSAIQVAAALVESVGELFG